MRVIVHTLFALLCASIQAQTPRTIEAALKPGGPWTARPTRTLVDLPSLPPDEGFDIYGGLISKPAKATGFFRAERLGDRWWLITPEGHAFINKGIAGVRQTRSEAGDAALKQKFGDVATWATKTGSMLHDHGFNGCGSWSDVEALGAVKPQRMVTTRVWSFMSSFGGKIGVTFQRPGHTGYKNDAIPVFHPKWEAHCDEYAKKNIAPCKDDPWLLGHFTDNELPFTRKALKNFIALPKESASGVFAREWLKQRHQGDITEQDERDFLALVVERYFNTVAKAIRKYDPNHLILGSRFHGEKTGSTLTSPEIFNACGPHVDVISVNWYREWTPDPARLAMWERESHRPVLITEWYAKALDSGMANTGGAGWLVRTQQERGQFYQHFALGLLESKACVGWHWFKYSDNDPDDKAADPSNRDSNKGIVNALYEPYTPLLDAMKPLNGRVYGLIQHFDSNP